MFFMDDMFPLALILAMNDSSRQESTRRPSKVTTRPRRPRKNNSASQTRNDSNLGVPTHRHAHHTDNIPPSKVASLPFIRPSRGLNYMHDELHMLRHNHLSVRDSESTRAVPVLAYRAIKCGVNTIRARLKPTRTDTSENPAVPTPLNAIGPGEVERPMGRRFDWTRDWDFLLSMKTYSDDGKQWMADACL